MTLVSCWHCVDIVLGRHTSQLISSIVDAYRPWVTGLGGVDTATRGGHFVGPVRMGHRNKGRPALWDQSRHVGLAPAHLR